MCVNVRVVCHVHHCLLHAVAHQLRLVLHPQHRNLFSIFRPLARGVHDADLHFPGEPLFAVVAGQGEPHALAARGKLALVPARSDLLAHADGLGTAPDALAPAFGPAVEGVGAVVRG